MKDNDIFYCKLFKRKCKDMRDYIEVNCKNTRCRMCKYSERISA